jgi:hypothetical protein
MRYVIPSYTDPPPTVKTPLTASERTACVTILAAALVTPQTLEQLLNVLQNDGTLSGATKAKLDGDRVQAALDQAVSNGNLKTVP